MCELTAYHEAGHAWMALYLGGEVTSITIAPDNDDGPARFGDTQIVWHQSSSPQLIACSIRVALAGPAAEMIYRGEPYHPGFVAEWAADWQTAWGLAAQLYADHKQRLKALEQVTRDVLGLLNEDTNWATLAAIVDHLIAHERLEAIEVAEIFATWHEC